MKKALFFYSGFYDPNIIENIDNNGGLVEYLSKNGFKLQIVDILKDPLLAEEFNIVVSPILLLIINKEEKRYVGSPEEILNKIILFN